MAACALGLSALEPEDPSASFRYPAAPSRVLLARGIAAQIVAEAEAGLPNEACGLLAGAVDADGARHVERAYPIRNADASPEHFSMDPAEQLAAVKDMRGRGLAPLGNWHSHPATASRPSAEDVRLAYDPAASYLILSLAGAVPRLRAFHIEDGAVAEEALATEGD